VKGWKDGKSEKVKRWKGEPTNQPLRGSWWDSHSFFSSSCSKSMVSYTERS